MRLPEKFECIPLEVTDNGVKVETCDSPTRGSTFETLTVSVQSKADEFADKIGERVAVERYKCKGKDVYRIA